MATNANTNDDPFLGESRRLIVEQLASGPLSVNGLAAATGLHPNTVRWHLRILVDAALVSEKQDETQGRGRPRKRYTLITPPSNEYQVLARILLAGMSERPAESCEASGYAFGQQLAADCSSDAEPVAALAELLQQNGFEPTVSGDEIAMRRCPFLDLATLHPAIVCAAHRGVVTGVLSQLEPEVQLEELQVLPRPGVCILRLKPKKTAHQPR